MYKAERLFQLVVLLRRSRTVTARELAGELGVSERTIYRDVQSLILSGVPVEGEAGVGYVLRRDFQLPPLMFTNEEAQALLLGARMVQAWGDPALERAARGVLDKVRAVAERPLLDDLDSQLMQVPGFHICPTLREKMGLVREGCRSLQKSGDDRGARKKFSHRPRRLPYALRLEVLGTPTPIRRKMESPP